MKTDYPIVYIKHIIQIKRHSFKQKTINKSCSVLSCRISGESAFLFAGENHVIKTGDVLYIPFGSTYYQECHNEEIVCFHFESRCDMKDEILICNAENTEELCSLFKKAAAEWKNKNPNYKCRCMSIFYEILSLCNFDLIGTKKVSNRLCKVAEYLDSHIYDSELTVDKLCHIANFSRMYFNKVFKNEYGVTPIEYINIQRIKKAKFLLESDGYSNEEISYLCGFNNVKYFYVVFKKITGMTTGEYKKMIK